MTKHERNVSPSIDPAKLQRLAETAIRVGLRLQPGQDLFLTAPVAALPLARRIADEAYKAGAGLVTPIFSDEEMALSRFRFAADASFDRAPGWLYEGVAKSFGANTARLAIVGEDPMLLAEADPAKVARANKANSIAYRPALSRDSRRGQRNGDALAVEIDDSVMDGLVECGGICEGVVGEVMGLEIAPDRLDVVEFRCVFGQPLDGEPVLAGGQGAERAFAGVDRTVVLDQHDWLGLSLRLRSKVTVELLQMSDEIAAALGRAGMDDELARDVIERPQNRDLLGLPRRRHTQVRARLRPGAGEIGMRQRLALI